MHIETLLTLMVIVYTVGVIFKRLSLPIILGELLAGLIFGPALLGVFHDSETIKILSELGVFFLLLHAGLETEPRDLLKASKGVIATGLLSFAIPFVLGYSIASLYGLSLLESLFIGLGISITAISVIIKIFRSFKMTNSKIAHEVMGAAILQEIIAFIFFSVLLSISQTEHFSMMLLGGVLLKAVSFFVVTIFIGQKILPFAGPLLNRKGGKAFTFTLIVAMFFGFIAERIGLHFVLGAFLAGIFVKEEITNEAIYNKIEDRIFAMSYSFLGPIFFVSIGFHVNFEIFNGDADTYIFMLSILVAAMLGKFIGGFLGSYLTDKKGGITKAKIIGLSMNGRGAVDLIIASIGLGAGIIDEKLFSILVLMAFTATLLTPLLLKIVLHQEKPHVVEESFFED